MATGLEVAGVVLACLPLIIEGLKHYQAGCKAIQRSIKYQQSLKKLIRSINDQKFYLEDNLRKISVCAGLEIDLDDGKLPELSAPGTKRALKAYLGDERNKHFLELLGDYEIAFSKLAASLEKVQQAPGGKPNNGRLTLPELHKITLSQSKQNSPFAKRVNYVIEESLIVSLTSELDNLNTRMDRIVSNRSELNKLQNEQKSTILGNERDASALTRVLKRSRVFTNSLFEAFGKCWTSCCHPCHHVALYLSPPEDISQPQKRTSPSSATFHTMLSDDPQKPASWHSTTVTILEDGGATATKKKTKVAFSVPGPNLPVITVLPVQPTSLPTIPIHIYNLCVETIKAKQLNKSLQLRLHHGHPFVHGGHGEVTYDDWDTVSLSELLTTKKRIMPRQKSKLTLKIAASVLQLDMSQWLHTSWSNQTLHFPRAPTIELDKPLIIYKFSRIVQHQPAKCPPRLLLLELGILLLEIFNEESFATFAKNAHKVQIIEDYMREGLAGRWFDATSEEMTERYATAVGTCLGAYARGTQTWDDDGVWKIVCAKVVAPLIEEWKTFTGSP